MDFEWFEIAVTVGAVFSVIVLYEVQKIANRIDAIEVDREWFEKKRSEQLESIELEISEVRYMLKDLVDFQKGDGRYRYDPDDPRLPAHVRDKTGREY
ncbi:hypothetical protein NJC38_07520 [Pseudomonas sp. 21LCFQ010]|uniref:hypothetical protein n=1 Tax=Pseudomonas sp. 21LCFQ010 TaxID=2957506 RepID=UPI002097A5D9|nr:hypothetical protein [Pseudomonas sp. 21LCFQ010]MCO8162005.1 hypothetical protein [Pseudomonas sp. 21LCFQ010]